MLKITHYKHISSQMTRILRPHRTIRTISLTGFENSDLFNKDHG